MDLVLDWVEKNRSRDTYETRRTYCNRFGSFQVGTAKTCIADRQANTLKGDDLVAWLARLDKESSLSAQTRRRAETSIKHCWNWATKQPSPTPYLPPTYRPFSSVERTYVPPKTLAENDLITEEEIEALFAAAKIDLDQFHRFGPKTQRTENPYCGFADLLKCYYHTGARTGELAPRRFLSDAALAVRQLLAYDRFHSKLLGAGGRERRGTPSWTTKTPQDFEFFHDSAGRDRREHACLRASSQGLTPLVRNEARMEVVVVLEYRFERTPDGAYWTRTGFAYPFWERYLEAFDGVRVVARVYDTTEPPGGGKRADGERVSFAGVPYYVGPWQYLRAARRVRTAVRNAVKREDAVILRVESHLANVLAPLLSRTGHPYGVEVVGDPYDLFAPGAVRHPFRAFFRWWFTRALRRQCAGAAAAAYVTKAALQRRYPPQPGAFSTSFSSVELPDEAFTATPRAAHSRTGAFTLVTVGTLAQLYKAPDVLLDAVAACLRGGLDLRLTVVGDGKHRPKLEARARALGLADRAHFAGELPAGDAVRAHLDRADLFVLPSWQEGLPRAMIEAMARGLPCVGSAVGGIPELLAPEELVPPGEAAALARKIGEVLTDPGRLARLSASNWEKAREFHDDSLRGRRRAFYRRLRERTEAFGRAAPAADLAGPPAVSRTSAREVQT